MTSGYSLRNVSDRTTYPLWAMREKGWVSNVLITDAGPPINTQRPLERYTEDYDYLEYLGFSQGIDFELNEQNARWCVTPE